MSSVDVCLKQSSCRFSTAGIFVVSVWIVMLAGALGFLARFAVNVPYAEDGMLIPYVAGGERVDMTFLWCQYSSHIIPLPKFVLIHLARWTHDFRTSMYVSVLTCGVAAFALTLAARSQRGHFEYSDAFFALGLLHLAHWESFLLGFAIQEVMSTAFLAIMLLVILRSGEALRRGQALLVGMLLVLLPTTGTAGLLLAMPLIAWLAYSAWISWRVGGPDALSMTVLQLLLVVLALASLTPYFFNAPHKMLWIHGPASTVQKGYTLFLVVLQILTLGFGTSAASAWLPFLNGPRAYVLVGSVILFLVAGGQVLLFARRQSSADRLRRVGLFLYLVANLFVVAGIAFGRGGVSKTIGLSPRYSLYAVPLLWGIYFIWQIYGPRLTAQLVPIGLFAFACAMFSFNMQSGYTSGEARHAMLQSVERDILKREVPAADIASTYSRSVSGAHWTCYRLNGNGDEQLIRAEMTNLVNILRKAGIPARKQLDPPS